jgi:hypothetical protein
MIVELTPWQLRWAKDAGEKRTTLNINSNVKDKPDYQNHNVLQDDLTANIAACACELAVSIYLNQSWNGAYWLPSEHKQASVVPDVGRNIEVRRVRDRKNPMPVKESEQQFNIFQAYNYPENPKFVEITGWAPGWYAWNMGKQVYPEKRALDVSLLWDLQGYERED